MKRMERTMDKHSFKKFAAILLAGCFCFLCFPSCRQKDDYHGKGYTQEELLSTFASQKQLFHETADVIIENQAFWENARKYQNAGPASLMSPNDTLKMNLFTQTQQQTLKNFFDQIQPYQISLENKHTSQQDVMIHFVNKNYSSEDNDGFTIVYYFGDKTGVIGYESNDFEKWISNRKDTYSNFIVLEDNWFLYY